MNKNTILNIGFDDTDSPKGMCTTFLAYKIVNSLKKENVKFLDFPKLIRFNPNIPWKTRGNGAVGLKIKTDNPDKIKKKIISMIKKFSDTKNGANPGLVFYENNSVPDSFKKFSKSALHQLIQRNNAKKFVLENHLDSFYLGNGQGLIGAIGAIGYDFVDNTLELLSYRKKINFGKKREISNSSVKLMQEKTFPQTFNSYDNKKNKVLIMPHGPDPVFYGIRGEDPKSLFYASTLIQTDEKLDGYMLFKSNQGTGDHLQNEIDVKQLKPYSSGTITGIVCKKPIMEKGGHTFFVVSVQNRNIACAVYKPTGLAHIALKLAVGDKIKIGGGIRKASQKHPRVLNIEFIDVLHLEAIFQYVNPSCSDCNRKMKSKGKNQGFQCPKCGKKTQQQLKQEVSRQIKNEIYIPVVSAHRHLSRPKQRFGKLNKRTKFHDSIAWIHQFRN